MSDNLLPPKFQFEFLPFSDEGIPYDDEYPYESDRQLTNNRTERMSLCLRIFISNDDVTKGKSY